MTTPHKLVNDLWLQTFEKLNTGTRAIFAAQGDERLKLEGRTEALSEVARDIQGVADQLLFAPQNLNGGVEDGRIRFNVLRVLSHLQYMQESAQETAALPGMPDGQRAALAVVTAQAQAMAALLMIIVIENTETKKDTDAVFQRLREPHDAFLASLLPPTGSVS